MEYSDKQLHAQELLSEMGEVPEASREEIMKLLEDEDTGAEQEHNRELVDMQIKMRMMEETDWRKRASLAALLISRSFDY